MDKTLRVPLAVYRQAFTRDSLGSQIPFNELVYSVVYAAQEDLFGSEFFRAKRLQYVEPRKYHMMNDAAIVVGMLLKDGAIFYTIESIERDQDQVWMAAIASRRRDMVGES